MEMTQEIVKQFFDYHEDGFLLWKQKLASKVIPGTIAGSLDKRPKQNRRYVIVKRKRYLCARLIFLYHKGYLPKIVDHRDRIRTNDKIENLRDVSYSESSKNSTSRKNSSSKYLGVNYHIKNKVWQAQIQSNGKQIYIGSFKTEDEAGLAYNKAAEIHHGEFANLNLIQP